MGNSECGFLVASGQGFIGGIENIWKRQGDNLSVEDALDQFIANTSTGRQRKIARIVRENLLALGASSSLEDQAKHLFEAEKNIDHFAGLTLHPMKTYYQILSHLSSVAFGSSQWIGVVSAENKHSFELRSGQGGKLFGTSAPEKTFGTILLDDRVFNGGKGFARTDTTHATIFVDGVDQIVNTKSGTAGVGLGLGMVGLGLGSTKHKNSRQDMRVASLVITDSEWQVTTNFHPDELPEVRAMVERFGPPQETQTQPNSSSVDQLAKLADLLDRGLISREEFSEEKRKILGT